MGKIFYFGGEYVPYDQARIHVEDRGNQFADGIYEVIRYYAGRPFEMEAHLERLQRSAEGIRLTLPMSMEEFAAIADEVVRRNGLQDANLYMQVTRGIAPRNHLFPKDAEPTVFMVARPAQPPDEELRKSGVQCMSLEDMRWKMCNIKSLALLPNVLARQEANDSGAYEGILVRDGIVTEGTATNVFAVIGKRLVTHPEGRYILSGITRGVVLELAERLRMPAAEEPFTLSELKEADEVFLTGTTVEVLPVVRLDGQAIGKGEPGPITTDLAQAFVQRRSRL